MAKNGKRLTIAEHNHLKSLKLQSDMWLLSKKMTDEWLLIHRLTGTKKFVPAP